MHPLRQAVKPRPIVLMPKVQNHGQVVAGDDGDVEVQNRVRSDPRELLRTAVGSRKMDLVKVYWTILIMVRI
jgi:hypothetical protein